MDQEISISDYAKSMESIPKEITSQVNMKDLMRAIDEKLKEELRRRVSYGKG